MPWYVYRFSIRQNGTQYVFWHTTPYRSFEEARQFASDDSLLEQPVHHAIDQSISPGIIQADNTAEAGKRAYEKWRVEMFGPRPPL